MITLPDGNKIDMRWKSVSYLREGKRIKLEIIPMAQGKDIILISTPELWKKYLNIQERDELIVLLEKIAWKRDIRVAEVEVEPVILNEGDAGIIQGTLESTPGGKKLEDSYLFDPQAPMSKEQVKEIYFMLEKRFAEAARGVVHIPKYALLKGSVLAEISVPTLKSNPNVQLMID